MPSMTSAGVLMTPYFMIEGMSCTLTTSASLPARARAFLTLS